MVMVAVAQSCPTLCDPADDSAPGSSVYGILNPSPLPRPTTCFSCVNLYEFDHNSPPLTLYRDLPVGQMVKESACSAGDPGSISGLEDPLEKEIATHSSILDWRIPWREEPGGLQSWGHKESDLTEQLTPPTL